ncbi:Wzt carbohydrate-binding domain-containing protein, partial [bacterium]|nr:Wzt carbohydrate-binding domain-containing protein [bacterium]
KNSTILMVSHDQNAIMTLCDKVAWLHEGKLVAIGKPKEIMQRYTEVIYQGMDNVAAQGRIGSVDVEEIMSHSAESSFGAGKAGISRIRLRSLSRGDIEIVYGGEEVVLEILVEAREDIARPLVGFLVKNRLGIELFGDNNLTLEKEISSLAAGATATISFSFKWPLLAAGSYAITAAIADGTLEGHQQQHWVHDMLVVEVARQRREVGLFNLENITLEVML